MQSFLDDPNRFAAFIAHEGPDGPAGFAEASIRHDYVNGTHTSPVGFLEGIYVMPGQRRKGIAAALVESVSAWAQSRGCTELASDSELGNEASQLMHQALGFRETERVVYFCRQLADSRKR
jgi:aminoglycoside 6'-N-acetyltransferase I